MDALERIEECDRIWKARQALEDVSEYDWSEIISQAKGLFTYAPFKKGDRVKLKEDQKITEKTSWGWLAYKHILIKGCEGIIDKVSWDQTHGFSYWIIIRVDSYQDSIGKITKTETKPYLFHFYESSLERA